MFFFFFLLFCFVGYFFIVHFKYLYIEKKNSIISFELSVQYFESKWYSLVSIY